MRQRDQVSACQAANLLCNDPVPFFKAEIMIRTVGGLNVSLSAIAKFCSGCAISFIGYGSVAAAETPPAAYVELDAGASVAGQIGVRGSDAVLGPISVTEKLKSGWMGSALIGHQLGHSVASLEAEAIYLNNNVRSSDLNAAFGADLGLRVEGYGGSVNLKLQTPTAYDVGGLKISPYVAGGVGYGQTNLTVLGTPYAGDGVLWQAKAGLSFQTGTPFTWNLSYRYVAFPEFTTNKYGLNVRLTPDAHVLSLGVQYAFGPR